MYSDKPRPSHHDNDRPPNPFCNNSLVYALIPTLNGQTPSTTLELMNSISIHAGTLGNSHSTGAPRFTSALSFPCVTLDSTPTTPSLTLVTPRKLAAAEKRRIRPPRFSCPLCPQMFTTQRNLENHHNSHFGIKVHHCDRCNEAFSTKSSRVRHQKKCM